MYLRSMLGFQFNLQLLQITVICVLYYTEIYIGNRVEDPDVNSKDTRRLLQQFTYWVFEAIFWFPLNILCSQDKYT